MIRFLKKSLLFVCCLLFAFIPCFSFNTTLKAKADTTNNYYDSSSVKKDLTSDLSSMFNLVSLESILSDIKFITFLEYGFETDNYSLYVYVSKTDSIDIDASSFKNKLQFGVSSSESGISSVSYSKYNLIFVNSDTVNGLECFKFKVNGFSLPNTYTSSTPRYYCISGIEILTSGQQNATEYKVGSVYLCTTNNGNTTMQRKSLTTISVDVNHTFYRSTYSDRGIGWANQVSSCYFALPKNFSLSGDYKYGDLTGVNAEFHSYFTSPILILNNEEVYNDFCAIRGKDENYFVVSTGDYFQGLDFSHISDNTPRFYKYNVILDDNNLKITSSTHPSMEQYGVNVDRLYWVFLDENANFNSSDYFFSGDNLKDYYYNDSLISSLPYLATMDFLFVSKDDFSNYSLCDFDYGYNNLHYVLAENTNPYDEDDTVTGFSLKEDDSNFLQRLFRSRLNTSSFETKSLFPIVKVNVSDMSKTDDQLSELYFIDKSEISDFKAFVNSQNLLNKDVYIFRYDCCEYFGQKVKVSDYGLSYHDYNGGLCCQEMIYFDFDIISFDFTQDGRTSTIPVIHSPEDVFNSLTPAPNTLSGCGFAPILILLEVLFLLVLIFAIYLGVTKIITIFKK